jgi:hypothetical protein
VAGSASWVIAATGAKVTTGLLALVVIAQRAHPKTGPAQTTTAPRVSVAKAPSPRAWTPPQLPQPLVASTTPPPSSHALPSREELLRKAREAASQARPHEVAAEREKLAPVSQFDQMGRLTETPPTPKPNLDEVLQRRRAV